MKKIIFTIFCLIAISTNAFATPTLTLKGKNSTAGSTIKLALTLAGSGGQLASISSDIAYNPDLFESVTAEIGAAGTSAGKEISSNIINGNKLRIGIFSITNNNLINDGVVAYINLKAKSSAAGTASLENSASGSDTTGQEIAITGNTAQISFGSSGGTSYKVLTAQSSSLTVNSGETVKVFGSGGNTITLESGGKAECVNFIGENVVNIEESASGFTVRRSGATVYLENTTTGTSIKIPATKTSQTLTFAGGVSYPLIISNGKVMFGSREVTLTAEQI
ncbi:MAG: hypothetical protein HQK72_06020 [Desulfamplus sp.]|nr:hypothetical protein [Desulfamplus sp.]